MKAWPALLAAFSFVLPADARLLSTRPQPSETFSPVLSLTIGGGVEYEPDRYEFPLLIEYNLTEQLLLSIEPKIVYDAPSAGWGDLETSVQWEFLRERRYRPALTAEGIVKWPTASNSDLGDPGHDYSLGLIASKDFVYVDVDVGVFYTSTGDPEGHDQFELTAAGEVPLNHRLSVLLESVTDFETGRSGQVDTEGTAGLAWRANSFLTLEFGGTLQSDGTWKVLLAWEWNFAGED